MHTYLASHPADLPKELVDDINRQVHAAKWSVPIKREGALIVSLTKAVELTQHGKSMFLFLYTIHAYLLLLALFSQAFSISRSSAGT